jgi:hypothetical protein
MPGFKSHHFAYGIIGGIVVYELYHRMAAKK